MYVQLSTGTHITNMHPSFNESGYGPAIVHVSLTILELLKIQ